MTSQGSRAIDTRQRHLRGDIGAQLLGIVLLSSVSVSLQAAEKFDPAAQPISIGPDFALGATGAADGHAVLYRPYFNDLGWWGDLLAHNLDSSGAITSTPSWSAATLLDAKVTSTRRILTRRDDTGAGVLFQQLGTLSAEQQSLIGDQGLIDYFRGDDEAAGAQYRQRPSVLGSIVHSSPRYVAHDPQTPADDRVYVGSNDGMLHAFDAHSGEEVYAYVPSSVMPAMVERAESAVDTEPVYLVDGPITVASAPLADGTPRTVLVSGLGAGGQAYFALDITDPTPSSNAALINRLMWEVNDQSTSMADLGYSYSRPLVVRAGSGQWVVIVGNGYINTLGDNAVGDGTAALLVLDLESGALIRRIGTGAGSGSDPNGLSSPTAVDLDLDGTVDRVYAGDLDGAMWAFDLTSSSPSAWHVAFSGQPFFSATRTGGLPQAITTAPRVVRHHEGGLLVLVGTGRTLSSDDVDPARHGTDSLYGLFDRLDGTRPLATQLVVQTSTAGVHGTREVRTSSASDVSIVTNDGWRLDLPAGERILSTMRLRNGNVLFSSFRPDETGGDVWTTEIRYATGGAPRKIIYDLNGDKLRTIADNLDGNGDADTNDPEDRVTALKRGHGLVVTSPRPIVIDAESGLFYVNQIRHSVPLPTTYTDAGVFGGHFDVDTASTIAAIGSGSTDAHIHEYDEKHDVLGVDYFAFHEDSLHEITEDIVDPDQRFKLIVVNADLSNRGRLSINQTYDEANPASYRMVTEYDDTLPADLPIFSLSGVTGSTTLDRLSIFFDPYAITERGLFPTVTGCVRSNTPGSNGEWRNGALTIWAVAVAADGSDDFELTYALDDPARISGITSGLLWESMLFWHWSGPCADEYAGLDAEYVDGELTTTIWEYYSARSLDGLIADPGTSAADIQPADFVDPEGLVPTSDSPPAALWHPGQTSWTEHLR